MKNKIINHFQGNYREFYGKYLQKQKQLKGDEFQALCPFHQDTNPSFSFNNQTSQYYCHGCGEKGDAFSFYAKLKHLGTNQDFPKILEGIASEFGISNGNGGEHTPNRRIEKIYDYKDLEGRTVHQTVKYEPKDFKQRRPDGKGGYIWKDVFKDINPILYNLRDVIEAKEVLILEGEKDADAANDLGFVGTTCAMGAGSWKPEYKYDQYLKDKDVILIPDNDIEKGPIGKEHMEQVAKSLNGTAKSIIWVDLPGIEKIDGGDLSDWVAKQTNKKIAKGHLDLLIREADLYEPKEEVEQEQEPGAGESQGKADCEIPKDFHLTDYGNAERLVAEHGQDLHYCFPFHKWFIWDGTCWQEDTTGEIKRRAKNSVRTLYKQAYNEPDDKTRKALATYATKCESQMKINAMISMAESELPLPVLPDQLDQHPFLISCNNGTIDLQINDLLPHDRGHLITRKIPFSYNMEARCPKWEAHLKLIMRGDKELISFLQRAWGSCLSGDTRDRKLFIEWGSGKNGKSVCNNTISMMLGEYAMRTPVSTLLTKRGDSIPNDVARLKGARFVYASEADQRRTLSEALVKDITGGEKIAARFMRGEWFEFQPEFKIWLGTNYKPTIKETTDAIWDRIALIPFTVRISDEEQRSMEVLLDEFRQEGEGIFRWLITGCYEWYHDGLRPPSRVTQATSTYRNEMDVLKQFINDRCIVREDLKCKAGDLYKAYCEWSDSNGDKPSGKGHFGDSLTERGFDACRYQRARGRSGIALLTEDNE